MGPFPWVFVLLRHSEINLHEVDSPESAVQDDTIFAENDVK